MRTKEATQNAMSKITNKVRKEEDDASTQQDRFHIAARIEKGLESHFANARNRSSDLLPLERKYAKLQSNLKVVKKTVKEFYMHLDESTKLRMNLTATLAEMGAETPIHDALGAVAESPAAVVKDSLQSVENEAASAAQDDLHDLEKVIDFVTEWEAIVTDKVEGEMKEVHHLHKRLNHYQDKVFKLRSKEHSVQEKHGDVDDTTITLPKHAIRSGVLSPEKLHEKLGRNEKKLQDAWNQHDARSSQLCNLLEEVTGYGWTLLHHLVRLLMKFESAFASHLNAKLSKLPAIMDEMTETYNYHNHGTAHDTRVPVAAEEYDSDSTSDDDTDHSAGSGDSPHSPKKAVEKMVEAVKAY